MNRKITTAPVTYFASQLKFRHPFEEPKGNLPPLCTGNIVVAHRRGAFEKKDLLDTAEQFFWANERSFPHLRQQLRVEDPMLMGSPLPRFPMGAKVKVSHPFEHHEPLRGQKGVVVGEKANQVIVEFLDFFREPLYPTEISKTR